MLVVGIGPGDLAHMTFRAREALNEAQVILGYETYLALVADLIRGKEVIPYAMGQEMARARDALSITRGGRQVAVVSGGDPGVYGMAGPVLEAAAQEPSVDIEVIPGVTAALAAAAALGAPLLADFAALSLSDLLIPWEVIEARLKAVAMSDLVAVLYNPRSQGRPDNLGRARRIFLQHRARSTPVGLVRNAGRAGEEVILTDLGALEEAGVDMFTTVIIGNSSSFRMGNRMLTSRGIKSDTGSGWDP